jgi:hypothetical protein
MFVVMDKLGLKDFWKQFANSPAELCYLEAHFRGASEDTHLALLECADESDFSIKDWVAGLLVLDHWLEANDLSLSMDDQIGYVCCAGESAGVGGYLSHLPTLVHEMLKAYGCERAVKK